ncbi:response regulator transcription factor [Mesorhizobium sp. BR1-1-16]|uniref:response regulator n=1 Tax=Mesorhizobium sp. BR1-1-16 TaxID=2876653 RepID=UPI001CCD5F42|nr:response regulator transcription factor [Mesorhizobium sp. BR1-1-16]MBZ9936554.1 response regulator transcription factor [Mesorhizobium sp. BR1-1-16]
MRILLVEDDEMLGGALRDHVAAEGHAVDWVRRIDDAGHAHVTVAYDLILLDLSLPDGRGLDFLKRLRRRGDTTPVMILTAMDQLSMRIDGLNAGADDYLVKPFDLSELMARLGAVARRYAGNPNPLVTIGPLDIDQANRTASIEGRRLDLTAREWAILERLAQRPGMLVSRPQLEDALYAFGAEIESNAVEVYVSRLRKKLGVSLIQTARGLGYRLATE